MTEAMSMEKTVTEGVWLNSPRVFGVFIMPINNKKRKNE